MQWRHPVAASHCDVKAYLSSFFIFLPYPVHNVPQTDMNSTHYLFFPLLFANIEPLVHTKPMHELLLLDICIVYSPSLLFAIKKKLALYQIKRYTLLMITKRMINDLLKGVPPRNTDCNTRMRRFQGVYTQKI